jgi:hypothetical protein
MQGTIIVHQGRIEINDERFYLSKKDIPVKPPTLKMQQVVRAKTILDELELFMRISTSSKHHVDKIQITTKKDGARMQRFELSEGNDRVTHSRALLIVRQLSYNSFY